MSKRVKLGYMLLIINTIVLFANNANDSISFIAKINERNIIQTLYFKQYTQNPALRYLRYNTSLSNFELGFDTKESKRPYLYQLGKGRNIRSLIASSYLKYAKHKQLWGAASFQKGKKLNITWNSSADIMRIYPYFTADTIGGNIDTETYAFLGGYSFNFLKGKLGLETGYRAMQEFRSIDPRPRNIVSDFTIKSAFSHTLFSSYTVALQLHSNVYKQKGNVEFYSELGSSSEWLMSGMGSSFMRFGGNQSSVYYKSYLWGGQIGIIPLKGAGFYLSTEYNRRFLERILQSRNKTPINSYLQHFTDVHLGYLHKHGMLQWGINSEWTYKNRKGKDYVVGDALAGEYKVLTKLPMFTWTQTRATLSFIIGQNNLSGLSWSIQPKAGIFKNKISNLHPAKNAHINKDYGELRMNVSWSNKKAFYCLALYGHYEKSRSASIEIPKALMKKHVVDYLLYTFDEYTAKQYSVGIKPSVAFLITAKLACNIAAEYNYRHSENDNYGHRFNITAGIRF